MSKDQFRSAVKKIKSGAAARGALIEDWKPAIDPLQKLSMPDLLVVMNELDYRDRLRILSTAIHSKVQKEDDRNQFHNRVRFAFDVVSDREIVDHNLYPALVNHGRKFLGCTPLRDRNVEVVIHETIREANRAIRHQKKGTEWAQQSGDKYSCCGALYVAWLKVLVNKRRAHPGASLNSDLAAAAHYMLARFHVCAAQASAWQMDTVIDGYDTKKRFTIGFGDRNLSSMAITPGNPPFPPDFDIRRWAKKGSVDGEADRRRCNSREPVPFLIPTVNGSEWGLSP